MPIKSRLLISETYSLIPSKLDSKKNRKMSFIFEKNKVFPY